MNSKFVVPFVVASSLFLASTGFSLTPEQKTEMYTKGTVTVLDEKGKKKGHFEVKFMPGAENITHESRARWHHAAETLKKLAKKDEFWKAIFIAKFYDGVTFMRNHVCSSKGVCGVSADFKEVKEDNAKLKGTFGSVASRLGNWLRFAGRTVEKGAYTAVGVVAGGLYAVTAPTFQVLYRPISAGTEAIAAGTLWPVMKYTWNGLAWELTKNDSEPKPGDMTVTFIPEKMSPPAPEHH